MKKLSITLVTLTAYLAATAPVRAEELVKKPATQFIAKGKQPSTVELASYEAKARQFTPSQEAGGVEAGTGTIVLAVIGAIAVVGAVLLASKKNQESQ